MPGKHLVELTVAEFQANCSFLLQVCDVSSKQQQSLLQMLFQGLHLFTGMVYDFAQGCQVPSGNQEICLVLGSEVAS